MEESFSWYSLSLAFLFIFIFLVQVFGEKYLKSVFAMGLFFCCIFENVVIENVNRYVAKQFNGEQSTKCNSSDSIFMLVWFLEALS